MHKVVDIIEKQIKIPILHIANATADVILSKNRWDNSIGNKIYNGARFYKSKLIEKGIKVIIPEKNDIDYINKVIYEELCLGIYKCFI